MRYLFALLALCVCLSLSAKPTPPLVVKQEPPKKSPIEMLPVGPCNWGELAATNGDFTLTGHACWEGIADMRTRANGSVYWRVVWRNDGAGLVALGIYEIESDGMLNGSYGYAGTVQFSDDGRLIGPANGERIYRVVPTPPTPDQ